MFTVSVFDRDNEHLEDYVGIHVKDTAVREAIFQSRRYPTFTVYIIDSEHPDRGETWKRGRRIGKALPNR